MPSEYRYHVFVDFWNYTISSQREIEKFSTDWKKIPKVLTREAGMLVDPSALAIYGGMNVYGSYNASTEKGLKNWSHSVLDTFPGVNAIFKARTKVRGFPSCPKCHAESKKCVVCDNDMRGTEEKGVDTRLATDLVGLAWEGAYDVAVLVTADQDFVPAAENLQKKGIKVIHAGFPPNGALLKQKCWASIDIPKYMREFEYKRST